MLNLMLARVVGRQGTPQPKVAGRDNINKGNREIVCDEVFDNMARALGSPMSRRQVIRSALVGIMGAAFAQVGVKTVRAAQAVRLCCRGIEFNPDTQCCTPSGIQPKRPITSLAACPNRVANGRPCGPNGCGSEGGRKYPDHYGAADFLTCCGRPGTSGDGSHDCCWGKCKNDRRTCDSAFLECLGEACVSAYPGGGDIETHLRDGCLETALAYYLAVSSPFATSAYEAAQVSGCDCCEAPGGQPCQTKYRCSCNEICYDNLFTCIDNCDPGLGCFAGICDPVQPSQC